MSSSRRQDFEDIADQGYGALGGGGADQIDRVNTKIKATGPELTCFCEACGAKNGITFGWDEAIYGSIGYLAPDWDVEAETKLLYPRVGCSNGACRRLIIIGFAPQELKRFVQTAIEQNFITKQWAEGYAANILAAAGRR